MNSQEEFYLQKIFGLHSPRPGEKLDKILQTLGAGHDAAKYYRMLMEFRGDGGISALRLAWERDLGGTI